MKTQNSILNYVFTSRQAGLVLSTLGPADFISHQTQTPIAYAYSSDVISVFNISFSWKQFFLN